MLYGLPGGWIYPSGDTSDILDRGLRRKKRKKTEEELLEEYLAAQILAGRKKEVLEAKRIAELSLRNTALRQDEKVKQIRLLMIFMMLDD